MSPKLRISHQLSATAFKSFQVLQIFSFKEGGTWCVGYTRAKTQFVNIFLGTILASGKTGQLHVNNEEMFHYI